MLPGMHPLHIYQILNHYTSRQDLDPGFDVLDNSANERPDWFEYWPIRKFLLNESLNEDAFYGFLSPKFRHKTNLSAALVRDFIAPDGGCGRRVSVQPEHSQQRLLSQRVRTRRSRASGARGHRGAAVRAHRSGRESRSAGLGFEKHGAFELFHRQAAVLAGVARGQRAAVRDRGIRGRSARQGVARADLLPGAGKRADEDIHHGARRHLDPHPRSKFRRASARSVRGAVANLQVAGGHRLRCAEDRLCHGRSRANTKMCSCWCAICADS